MGSPGISWDVQKSMRDYVYSDIRRSLGIYGDKRNHPKKKTKKKRKKTFVTTNLNKEILTLCLHGLQCVCVRFYMLIFTWYKGTYSRSIKTDGQESYARNTAFSETWQNGDPISSFSGHSGIYSDILSVFFWHMYLAYLLTFFLAFYLLYLRKFFVVEVWPGTL